ncbi:hypothetical protein FDZ73_24150, partial [bacterium]
MLYLLLTLLALSTFGFLGSLFQTMFKSLRSYHLRRRREITRLFKREAEEDIIIRLTGPVIKYLLPYFPFRVKRSMKDDLALIGWDYRLTVPQVQAMRLMAWITGAGAAAALWFAGRAELRVLAGLAAFTGLFIVD